MPTAIERRRTNVLVLARGVHSHWRAIDRAIRNVPALTIVAVLLFVDFSKAVFVIW